MEQNELISRINRLKSEKKAVILVHNYQRPEVYEVADFLGDSLELSMRAAETNAGIIVFCGVDFMAESAKILNPGKIVLIPSKEANCPMAGMVDVNGLKELKKKHPDAAVVSYINTNAEIKAESDICCTSANCVEIVNSLPNKKIIFTPDKNMADYIQTKTNRLIIPWEGFCYVHAKISADKVKEAKKLHPKAKVVAHPECVPEVIKLADHVCGTGGMIKYAKENSATEFIIATEEGMRTRLMKEVPGKEFYMVGGVCVQQKKINLQNIYDSLAKLQFKVEVPEKIMVKAKKALDKMLAHK